ncbi:hypothetical protein B0A55_13773, partial [Friedmanniomyces simplex]
MSTAVAESERIAAMRARSPQNKLGGELPGVARDLSGGSMNRPDAPPVRFYDRNDIKLALAEYDANKTGPPRDLALPEGRPFAGQ